MSEVKHSRGPWLYDDSYSAPILGVFAADNKSIFHDSRTTWEQDANARLIAAAPDLLESLKWAVGRLGAYTKRIEGQNVAYCDAYDRAIAAIAKAEGRQ